MSATIEDVRVKVSSERLYQSLMDLAKIGATDKGGNCRLALTELDGQGRESGKRVGCVRRGCKLAWIKLAMCLTRRSGRDNELPPIMTGSHIDTQPTGGRFDGCFGVLAGLEVVRAINDAQVQTEAPIEVVIWTNEEGTRFTPVMMGSGAFVGKFSLSSILDAKDKDGKRVGDELEAIGYAGQEPLGEHPVVLISKRTLNKAPFLSMRRRPLAW